MVSTAADYGRFCQFVLNGGILDGERLVSPKTIELMTVNHLPPNIGVDPEVAPIWGVLLPTPAVGSGFGLGFAVRTQIGGVPWHGSVGDLHWFGTPSGCTFFIDPREQLYAIVMTQAPEQLRRNVYLLRAMVYQALAG
jgi:CubicO group peptidase (beta-lactamase class C family)